jgi:hypothetical protein
VKKRQSALSSLGQRTEAPPISWLMRLSYGSATEAEIREGIRRLGRTLRSLNRAATPRRARPKDGSANAAPPRPRPARY